MLLNITCVHCRLHRVLDVASLRAIGSLEYLNWHRIVICKLIFLFVVVVKEFLSTSILFNRPGRYLLSTFGLAFARTTWPI